MPDTGSDSRISRGRYQFEFAREGVYGHVVQIMSDLSLQDGVVLDLGCGYGAVAEPLSALGLDYVGMDIDKAALGDLRARGFPCFEVDLQSEGALRGQVEAAVGEHGGKPVRAVLLLDVLEHLPSTDGFLRSIHSIVEMLDNPVLLLSVPNVAHVDVGAKLALGRFDYTPTGLLDSTHLSFFTESRLIRELAAHGWREIAANDFHLHRSDQCFPSLHPAVAVGASFANFIRHWRNEVDNSATINQFVRAFTITARRSPELVQDPASKVFLTVVVRTEGKRKENLRETLTCLAAQTCDDFTVKIMVHTAYENRVASVRSVLEEFDHRFAARCVVMQVVGGQRARPLNEALRLLESAYVAFLDDDDLVTGDWVETFYGGAKSCSGQVVRSVTSDQQVQRISNKNNQASYTVHTGLHVEHAPQFDMVQHFYANQTPICSFAVPCEVIDCFHLRFDEALPVTEDWEFLLRTTQIAGVHDTMKVTSVYRRWVTDESSSHKVNKEVWEGTRTGILHRFDQAPMLLPPGSASRMFRLYETSLLLDQARLEAVELAVERMAVIESLREQTSERMAVIESLREQTSERMAVIESLREQTSERMAVIESLREQTSTLKDAIARMETSLSWRITMPVRQVLRYVRRLLDRS